MSVQSKSLLSYENFVLAVSGAVGSVIGMVTFYPLDTVRSRLQLEDKRKAKNTLKMLVELVKEEGFCTLYRGIVPVLQSICVSNFIYFYTFHGLRAITKKDTGGKDLILASLAGAVNVLITTPLWMVSTRMKMAGVDQNNQYNYNSIIDGVLSVMRSEGVESLWRGTVPSLMLVSNPAIHMAVYEAIKRRISDTDGAGGTNLTAAHFFFISALSKTFATVLTYPLQLVQAKLRHGHTHYDLAPNAGTVKLLLYIMKRQGVLGVYKGMEAKLVQTLLTTALMFMLYEKIAAFVFRLMNKTKTS